MVLTFQQLKVVCRLGATMGPIGLWASGWLYPKSVITAPAATTPFSVVSLSTFPVSATISVMGQGRYHYAQPGGPGVLGGHCLYGLYPSTFSA